MPPAAATDPDVVAMLVKPRAEAAAIKADRLAMAPAADDVTGSITPAPHIVPASAEVEPEVATPKLMPLVKAKTRKATR